MRTILSALSVLGFLSSTAFAQTAIQSSAIANEGITGTQLNKIAKYTGSPSTAIVLTTSDTVGFAGIVTSGNGTSGNPVIFKSGLVSCVFDGATVSGHYVQASSTTAGDCHDTGAATEPSTGDTIGRVLSNNGGGGLYLVDMHLTPSAASGSGVTSVGLALPSIFTVSGSPISGGGSGTLTGAFNSAAANLFLATPSGSSGVPGLRAILPSADFPTSGATAGSYTCSNITVTAQGLLSSASNGTCGGGGGGPTNIFVGNFSGTANTYTMVAPSPAGFTLTDQYLVCGAINVDNTGDSTLNINLTGAVHVKVQNDAGLALLAPGRLQAAHQYCFTYQAAASAFIVTTQLDGHVTANAVSQSITAAQWNNGENFIPLAGQTFTLLNSATTLYSGNSGITIMASVATTLQASGSDTITTLNGTTSPGGNISVPAGSLAVVTGTGISPTAFNVVILYPPAATTTVVGVAKINPKLGGGAWQGGTNPDQGVTDLIAVPITYTITSIVGIPTVLAGGTAGVDLYDITSGAPSCQSGTKINSSSFNANALSGVGVPQTLFTGTYSLLAGHSVCLHTTTWPGSPASAAGITMYGQPL